jgi:HPt (histidine-containing phosphotransfer) domain-containing protein
MTQVVPLLLDRAAGLANAANDEDLYQSLLVNFKLNHEMDLEKAGALMETGDYQAVRRLAHTLKSTANLIGAKVLGGAALAVENAVQENGQLPAPEMLETLEREFDAVMAELGRIVPESAGKTYGTGEPLPGGEFDMVRALAFIRKLELLLDSRNPGSLNLRDDIRELLGPVGEECGKLISQIENFDFKEAAETLNQIREKAERRSLVN